MLSHGRLIRNCAQLPQICSSLLYGVHGDVKRILNSKLWAKRPYSQRALCACKTLGSPSSRRVWNGISGTSTLRPGSQRQQRCFVSLRKNFADDPLDDEYRQDAGAVPGALNLAVPSTSQLQEQSQVSKFLHDFQTYIKRQLFKYGFVNPQPDPQFIAQVAAARERTQNLSDIIDTEPIDTKEALITAILSELLLNQPITLCKHLPWLLSEQNDVSLPWMRNARSNHIIYYLYHHFLHSGLASASIAPEFYECLLEMLRTRGSYWGRTLLALLPKYFLKARCPMHLREELAAAYGSQLAERHHESSLLEIQQLSILKQFAAALGQLRDMRAFALVWRSIEYYNTIKVVLVNAEQHTSKKDAEWIVSQLMMLGLATNTPLCQLILQFAVKRKLADSVRDMSYNVMRSRLPSPTLIMDVQYAMKALHLQDDQTDPMSDPNMKDSALERSYAVNNSILRMRLHRLNYGQKFIYEDMLNMLQNHANVSFLVELGMAEHVRNPHMPFIDCQTLALMLWQFFLEAEFDDFRVMTVYNKFKTVLQIDNEMVRMACFPHAHAFNTFISAFGRMSKERLGDALDVLAELTHHHDPVKNKPQHLPEAMLNPRWLHHGPDGKTLRLLVYALVRHGQLQAAERCLGEIWKKWPECWNQPCDRLIKAYVEVGKNNRAAWLLNRKINAGFEVTGATMKALAARRNQERSARKNWRWNRIRLHDAEEDDSAMDLSEEDDQSWTEPHHEEQPSKRYWEVT